MCSNLHFSIIYISTLYPVWTDFLQEYGCCKEVVAIVALLSVDSVLFSPAHQRDKAAATQLKFQSEDGDHMTLLAIYNAYTAAHGNKVIHSYSGTDNS